MLIKAYGLYWNPEIVNWGSRGAGNAGDLNGKIKTDTGHSIIDFWGAKGIYVLHHEFRPIYVGKAFGTLMGPRLRAHLTDRLAGRWDMFSWFSISAPRITKGDVSQPGRRTHAPETVTNTLEALAILIADPALNRKRESLDGAYEAEQHGQPNPRSIRSYLEDILARFPQVESTRKQ